MIRAARGFSLVESMVIVSMISILSVMSLRAIPALRSHQELIADTEKIRALLLDAKQRTLNQIRPDDCLDTYDVDDPVRAACSDTGLGLQWGEIIEFSNSYYKGKGSVHIYDYDFKGLPRETLQSDYVINRSKPVTRVQLGSPTSLLFKSTPPTVELYRNGTLVTPDDDSTKITLIASNGSKRTLTIYSSGTIDVDYE
ncbi:MAG: hypothetical protein O3A36_02515 [bacterium]|nr:hypothetical protein [bacterium]